MSLPSSETLLSPDLSGQTLGDYLLLRRLGRGGMADVYLARQGSLDRNVALKILKPDLAKDDSYVKRFHREAQSAAALVQANIVQIYEVNQFDGYHCIAQEYIHGRNLRQYLDRHGAVEPVMALTVLRQCGLALQKAGEMKVIHRDIKPENIMVSTSGEVKVADFGLARVNNDATQQTLTQIGITMGTPLYMSPEQVEGKPLDSRSDLYSLGVTVYHMLAGHPPFQGESPLAIAVQQVKNDAVPLTQLRPDVPAELCQLVHRLIEKQPDQRPDNPAKLIESLRKIKIDKDEDWDALIAKLAVTNTDDTSFFNTNSQSRLAVTQQLQAAMLGHIQSWWKRPQTIIGFVALGIVGLITGIMTAVYSPPAILLNIETETLSEIPRKSHVAEQYEAAYWGTYALSPDEDQTKTDYWKAVLDYFPLDLNDDENANKTMLYHCRAQARLGEIYLTQKKLQPAMEIYHALEGSENVSEHFRVMGIAGKALVNDLLPVEAFAEGEIEREQKVRHGLSEIGSRLGLLNEFMRQAIEEMKERYPSHLQILPPSVQRPFNVSQ